MEKLIYIDDEDRKLWYDLVKNNQDKYINGSYEPNEEMLLRTVIQNNTSKFWDTMHNKYPYIRNKRIALNLQDGFIFSWNSPYELNQFRR